MCCGIFWVLRCFSAAAAAAFCKNYLIPENAATFIFILLHSSTAIIFISLENNSFYLYFVSLSMEHLNSGNQHFINDNFELAVEV